MGKRVERGVLSVLLLIAACVLLMVAMRNKTEDSSGVMEAKVSSDIYVNDAAKDSVMEAEQDKLWVLFDSLAFERKENFLGTAAFSVVLILYIILIGPVIYFLMKKRDKMEWMWVLIPSMAVMFTILIMGFRENLIIKEPVLDSVTVISPEAEHNVEYLSAVSPGRESYRLTFSDSAVNVMPLYVSGEESLVDSGDLTRGRNYKIYDQEKLFLEITPEHAFSDGYFRIDLDRTAEGEIDCQLVKEGEAFSGTVYNNTEWDFSWLFLYADGKHCLISDVLSGDTPAISADLWSWREKETAAEEEEQIVRGSDMAQLIEFGYQKYFENADADEIRILGIISDYESSVETEETDQISYGLFYMTSEMPE